MSAKCRVCHRELQSAEAIAAGIGPTCAANVARRQTANDLAQRTAYPAAKLERINRSVAKLGRMLEHFQRQREIAYAVGTPEQQRDAEWAVRLVVGWYGCWKLMQIRAQRMAGSAQAAR